MSNADPARGVSCIAERRAREIIAGGKPLTPFLAAGDTVAIEMLDDGGRSLFGRIEQRVVAGEDPNHEALRLLAQLLGVARADRAAPGRASPTSGKR